MNAISFPVAPAALTTPVAVGPGEVVGDAGAFGRLLKAAGGPTATQIPPDAGKTPDVPAANLMSGGAGRPSSDSLSVNAAEDRNRTAHKAIVMTSDAPADGGAPESSQPPVTVGTAGSTGTGNLNTDSPKAATEVSSGPETVVMAAPSSVDLPSQIPPGITAAPLQAPIDEPVDEARTAQAPTVIDLAVASASAQEKTAESSPPSPGSIDAAPVEEGRPPQAPTVIDLPGASASAQEKAAEPSAPSPVSAATGVPTRADTATVAPETHPTDRGEKLKAVAPAAAGETPPSAGSEAPRAERPHVAVTEVMKAAVSPTPSKAHGLVPEAAATNNQTGGPASERPGDNAAPSSILRNLLDMGSAEVSDRVRAVDSPTRGDGRSFLTSAAQFAAQIAGGEDRKDSPDLRVSETATAPAMAGKTVPALAVTGVTGVTGEPVSAEAVPFQISVPPMNAEAPADPKGSIPGSAAASVAVETTALLAAQIARRLEGRSSRFEMSLTPDELGRVDISLDIDADGGLTARLAFETPQAAMELRGRAEELRRQLQEAGFTVGDDSLSFSEREAGSSGGGADQRFERQAGRAFAGASRLIDEVETPVVSSGWISHSQTPQGVDLQV